MTHAVEWSGDAEKELGKLDRPMRRRVIEAARKLGDDPYPPNCRKIVTANDLWRIRVGDYRVKYTVLDDRLIVLVVEVVHRSRAY